MDPHLNPDLLAYHGMPVPPVEYPDSDGMPMAESEEHGDALYGAIELLREHFTQEPLIYVGGNNFLYWVEGAPREVVSPDVYVVKGVPKLVEGKKRRRFKVWEEGGRKPSFVLEVTSRSTRSQDLGEKMSIYRDDLQVPEYFIFDLAREWLEAGLKGYTLRGGVYLPIEPGPGGRLPSAELGLELATEGRLLRFFLPGAPEPLATPRERADRERERADHERERADHERERAERAEAELARLRAELERLKDDGR